MATVEQLLIQIKTEYDRNQVAEAMRDLELLKDKIERGGLKATPEQIKQFNELSKEISEGTLKLEEQKRTQKDLTVAVKDTAAAEQVATKAKERRKRLSKEEVAAQKEMTEDMKAAAAKGWVVKRGAAAKGKPVPPEVVPTPTPPPEEKPPVPEKPRTRIEKYAEQYWDNITKEKGGKKWAELTSKEQNKQIKEVTKVLEGSIRDAVMAKGILKMPKEMATPEKWEALQDIAAKAGYTLEDMKVEGTTATGAVKKLRTETTNLAEETEKTKNVVGDLGIVYEGAPAPVPAPKPVEEKLPTPGREGPGAALPKAPEEMSLKEYEEWLKTIPRDLLNQLNMAIEGAAGGITARETAVRREVSKRYTAAREAEEAGEVYVEPGAPAPAVEKKRVERKKAEKMPVTGLPTGGIFGALRRLVIPDILKHEQKIRIRVPHLGSVTKAATTINRVTESLSKLEGVQKIVSETVADQVGKTTSGYTEFTATIKGNDDVLARNQESLIGVTKELKAVAGAEKPVVTTTIELNKGLQTGTILSQALGNVGRALRRLSWGFTWLSMAALGVFFSMQSVFNYLRRALGLLVGPLMDLESLFTALGMALAFGPEWIAEQLGEEAVESLIKAWQTLTGWVSTATIALALFGAEIINDPRVIAAVEGALKALWNLLSDKSVREAMKLIVIAFANAIVAFGPLIDKLSDFIVANKALLPIFAKLMIALFATSMIAMLLMPILSNIAAGILIAGKAAGFLSLMFNLSTGGIGTFIKWLLNSQTALYYYYEAASWVGSAAGTALITSLALIVAALGIMYIAWKRDWGGIRTDMGPTVDYIIGHLGRLIDYLVNYARALTYFQTFQRNVFISLFDIIPDVGNLFDWLYSVIYAIFVGNLPRALINFLGLCYAFRDAMITIAEIIALAWAGLFDILSKAPSLGWLAGVATVLREIEIPQLEAMKYGATREGLGWIPPEITPTPPAPTLTRTTTTVEEADSESLELLDGILAKLDELKITTASTNSSEELANIRAELAELNITNTRDQEYLKQLVDTLGTVKEEPPADQKVTLDNILVELQKMNESKTEDSLLQKILDAISKAPLPTTGATIPTLYQTNTFYITNEMDMEAAADRIAEQARTAVQP